MTIESWLEAALADARRRQLADLEPLLEALALSTRRLRAADLGLDAGGTPPVRAGDVGAAGDRERR
jgi:hypothetical protein